MKEKEVQEPAHDPAESNEKAPNKPQPNLDEQREGSFRDAEDNDRVSKSSTPASESSTTR